MWGFTAMSLACVVSGIGLMPAGNVSEAMVIVLIPSLGQVVRMGSIRRLKAAR